MIITLFYFIYLLLNVIFILIIKLLKLVNIQMVLQKYCKAIILQLKKTNEKGVIKKIN